MKKVSFLLILFVFLTLNPIKAKAVDLGPFQVGLGFCSQVNKLSSILNSYTIIQWPVTGTPGITTGMMSNTSVILDFCNYLTQLESLDTVNAIQYSANYLNQLTNKKWDDNFKQLNRFWDISNTLYDMESGSFRKGALESASTHREINDFVKDTDEWYQNRFNGRDSSFKSRGERQSEINNLARISYQRSILKEATNCPEPDTNTNYQDLYSKQMKDPERIKEESDEDMKFYKEKLYEMGTKISGSMEEVQAYTEALDKFETLGVSYKVQNNKGSMTTYKPKKTGSGATAKVTQEKKVIDTVVQKWSAESFQTVLNDFKTQYADKWKTWVTAQWVSEGSYGILDNPQARIERDFQDIGNECNRQRIARNLDSTKASYEKDIDDQYKKCIENVKLDQKTSENLLNYYADKYFNSIYKYKQNNAKIWSLESQYLGRNRSVTSNNAGDYQQEEVKCEANLQPIEMEKLRLKMQNVENDLNQQIALTTMKQTDMMVKQAEQEAELKKQYKMRNDFTEKQRERENKKMRSSGTVISPIK